MEKKLYIANTNRKVVGRYGGLGEYFNVDTVIFRGIFLISFLLIVLFLISGCSSRPDSSQRMLLMREKESQGDYAAVVDLAIEGLKDCRGRLSNGCLIYLNDLWLSGLELLYQLDYSGDYELFGEKAKQLVKVNENYPDYHRLIKDIIRSKHPWLGTKDEEKLIQFRNDPYTHLYIYYALAGQMNNAQEILDKLERESPHSADSIRKIIQSLEEINVDNDKKLMAQTLLAMRMPLSSISGIVRGFWPTFEEFHMPVTRAPVDFKKELSANLEASRKAIYSVIISGNNPYWMMVNQDDENLIKNLFGNSKDFISEKDPLFNIFQCSYASIVGNIIACSKGWDMRVIVTQDKAALARLKKAHSPSVKENSPSLAEESRPNHVLNLLKINDNAYIFVDFINVWVSEPFDLKEMYINTGGYYELLIPGERDDLYEHFFVIPNRELRGMIYQVLACALHQSEHEIESYKLFEKSLYFWPDNFQAYVFLSRNMPEDEKALNPGVCDTTMLTKSLLIYPKNSDVYMQLGFHYFGAKDYVESAENFTKAVRIDRGDFLTLSMLGEAQLSMEQYQAAVKSFQDAIALNPNYAMAYDGLGRAYWLMSDLVQAGQALRKALELYEREGDTAGAKKIRIILEEISHRN